MANRFKTFVCAGAAIFAALSLVKAQTNPPSTAPSSSPEELLQKAPLAETRPKAITPPLPSGPSTKNDSSLLLVQASTVNPAPSATVAPTSSTTTTTTQTTPAGPVEPESVSDNGGIGVREFQGDDVGAVLRLLARQAKINMVVSEAVVGTVTMRLEDVTALQAVSIIVKAKGLFMDKIDNVYYIKTGAERTAEPTESDSYQFSYARAKEIAPLVAAQLSSKDAPQVDERTNTLFFRETRGNIDVIRKLLSQIDKPTKQVMIEARLVEVTANPRQSYGINWGGVFGGSTSPQTIKFAGSDPAEAPSYQTVTDPLDRIHPSHHDAGETCAGDSCGRQAAGQRFLLRQSSQRPGRPVCDPFRSATVGHLAGPQRRFRCRVPGEPAGRHGGQHAGENRNHPQPSRSPQLNFNEQTATAIFGGFQDKKFGNTLVVKPSVNKDNFITLAVKPEISNKVGDQAFFPPGASQPVSSPIIDTRSLDSNVLIKSGDTLAIGGLLQDEVTKARTQGADPG